MRKVLIVLALAALALLAWQAHLALLITFAGIVVAVLLSALAHPLETRLSFGRPWALLAAAAGLAGLLALAGALVGAEVAAQVKDFLSRLPEAIGALGERFGIDVPRPGQTSGEDAAALLGAIDPSWLGGVAGQVASVGGALVNALSALVVAVIGGWFLAADPALYRRGVTLLLPLNQRRRTEVAMEASGEALRLWLGAQAVSMLLIGILAWLGTWAIGLPSPVALGLFAGLAAFVPLIGAVAGAVPALLLALTEGGDAVLWTAGLFIAIQQLESNMIAPLVQRHMVDLPPALVLFAVVAIGLLFGLPGVILAAPITVAAFVLVKLLYVRETLGHDTEVPGEEG
ncbi:AI-2E family transporter [Elioraea sp.]|uniref:AI-2E family transporter n=1 Tax=Elioraea sp. TaxID=2185103 RepID=UPI0025C37BA5|nr:AI-2E family transporter [Elioraea sp.]